MTDTVDKRVHNYVIIIPTDSNEAHLPTPRYGQYLTHAHNSCPWLPLMAATARVIWLCACVRYWPYRGVGRCASLLSFCIVTYVMLFPDPDLTLSYTEK